MRSLDMQAPEFHKPRVPVPSLALPLCEIFIRLLKILGAPPLPRVDNNTYVTGLL